MLVYRRVCFENKNPGEMGPGLCTISFMTFFSYRSMSLVDVEILGPPIGEGAVRVAGGVESQPWKLGYWELS